MLLCSAGFYTCRALATWRKPPLQSLRKMTHRHVLLSVTVIPKHKVNPLYVWWSLALSKWFCSFHVCKKKKKKEVVPSRGSWPMNWLLVDSSLILYPSEWYVLRGNYYTQNILVHSFAVVIEYSFMWGTANVKMDFCYRIFIQSKHNWNRGWREFSGCEDVGVVIRTHTCLEYSSKRVGILVRLSQTPTHMWAYNQSENHVCK